MKPDRRWACHRHHAAGSHIRNQYMLAKRRERKESGNDVAKNAGLCFKTYYLLEKKQKDPLLKNLSGWRETVLQLCDYWVCEPEDIFPEDAKRLIHNQAGTAELALSAYAQRQASPESLEYAVLRKRANKILAGIRVQDREILIWYVIDGLHTQEIADRYGVSPTAVHLRMTTALRNVRQRAMGVRDTTSTITSCLGPEFYPTRGGTLWQ